MRPATILTRRTRICCGHLQASLNLCRRLCILRPWPVDQNIPEHDRPSRTRRPKSTHMLHRRRHHIHHPHGPRYLSHQTVATSEMWMPCQKEAAAQHHDLTATHMRAVLSGLLTFADRRHHQLPRTHATSVCGRRLRHRQITHKNLSTRFRRPCRRRRRYQWPYLLLEGDVTAEFGDLLNSAAKLRFGMRN